MHVPTRDEIAVIGQRTTSFEQTDAEASGALATDAEGLALPWQPQPDESAQDYAAFVLWLEGGAPEVKHALARRRAWAARRRLMIEQIGEIDVAGSLARDAATMRACAVAKAWCACELSKHLAATAKSDFASAPVKDVARVLKEATLLERLVAGQSTANVAVTADYGTLSDEDLATLAAIDARSRAAGGPTGGPAKR